jgi:hypothetical protein
MVAKRSRLEQNLDGDAATGIPVVSASGEELMPCKPAKALSLLDSGKAVRKWTENGTFYLQLKFDPKSPIVHPETSLIKDGEERDGDRKVWNLVRPDKASLKRLVSAVLKDWDLRKKFRGDLLYLQAVLKARLEKIRSPLVMKILASKVKKLLKALGGNYAESQFKYEGSMDKEVVMGALSIMCDSIYRVMKVVAEQVSQIAQRWGNTLARTWPEDHGFIKYLTMMNLPQNNNPRSIFTIRF